MEPTYHVEERDTTGWTKLTGSLSKQDASNKIQSLIQGGSNPRDIRIVRDS